MSWCAALAAAGPALGQEPNPLLPDSVAGGWKVFAEKGCIRCHAVWGLGGQVGPELGRTEQRHLTASQLAGTMLNHIPKMHSYMVRSHLEYPRMSAREMTDLFSFLYFARYLDEPGEPVVGKRILRDKGCSHCHKALGPSGQPGPDLKRWASFANPIVWAQKMWEHAPKMKRAMKEQGITWPTFNDTDLVNIMAYMRSVGSRGAKVYLQPGSPRSGAKLFVERKCRSCHFRGGIAEDLATSVLPRSLAALASRMWNHSPEMTRLMAQQGIPRSALTAQEMADIIAYIISLRYADLPGDPQKGRAVFEKLHCAECHSEDEISRIGAPPIEKLAASASGVRLAQAMWNHGPTMMDRMSEIGIAWPVFQSNQMADLIAYLRSVGPAGEAQQAPLAPSKITPLVQGPPITPDATCVSSACHPGIVAGQVVHAPAAQGECDACHALLNPQTHHFVLTSRTSELCYQCHDEPAEITPLHGSLAASVCTACHNPHSAENAFGPGFTGNEVCFADMVGTTYALETLVGTKVPPKPEPGVSIRRPIPEAPRPAPTALAKRPPAAARVGTVVAAKSPTTPPPTRIEGGCVTNECHPEILSSRVVHAPTEQEQCDACHTLTDEPKHRFELVKKEPELCYECHDRPEQDYKFEHGPVGLGMCTPCHDPHGAPHKVLLPEAGSELCFMCHTEMGAHVNGARVKHQLTGDKDCNACHDPHRSNIKFQLKKRMPELCFECHEPIREIIEAAVVSHDPVDAGKKCVNCHNPHGSDVPQMLVNAEIDLCLDCHNKYMDTPSGPIVDMRSWIENNPEHHGPIREGNCTGCHQPHGSENFRILRHAFPHKFYRPFSLEIYALCFECHEETLVLDARTTTLTDFRNGDNNLHHLHVNQEKGRTCRACHEIHAGTKPKRIKDFVPFGNWKYPVNFEMTEHGGRCAPGCHVPRGYDRREAVIQK